MENKALGVRKGAWSKAEDALLRKCVETYGEGKWHLVPLRAGLNRCRKSCRLRWLNYLRPDINRTRFSVDEIDLLMRLHKLLGNRWTLIAGRLPGRTANDVKNFWNSNVQKKRAVTRTAAIATAKEDDGEKSGPTQKVTVIKPRPIRLPQGRNSNCNNDEVSCVPTVETTTPANLSKSPSLEHLIVENGANNGEEDDIHESSSSRWWRDLLETTHEFSCEFMDSLPPGEPIDLFDSMFEDA